MIYYVGCQPDINDQLEETVTTAREKAEQFLAVSHMFKLGTIPTETPHPKTVELSRLACEDLNTAIRILKEIDLDLFPVMKKKLPELIRLNQDIRDTISTGGRIFFSGCGATGRLSLSLEVFWREQHEEDPDRVIGFMAGGDNAIIKAIEKFEDHPEFAVRHMKDLGFSENDLLIASTEGGETPFVIGTAEYAVEVSRRKPYFLYCNPDESLMNIERSRKVIENDRIVKINLFTAPQALSGSTRMQASTILMASAGLALFSDSSDKILAGIEEMETAVRNTDYSYLKKFIEAESAVYKNGDFIVYETDRYGITILTDSTERAPTFSLKPFENRQDPETEPALCYICYPDSPDSVSAWNRLFKRAPRPLNWDGKRDISLDYLYGFDFSSSVTEFRKKKVSPSLLHTFQIFTKNDCISMNFRDISHCIPVKKMSLLCEHTLLKTMLNIHSTLIMGRLGRYVDNIMVWVRPSNNKLIDRSIRYIRHLLSGKNIDISYEETAHILYEEIEKLKIDEPIVLKTVERICRDRQISEKGQEA